MTTLRHKVTNKVSVRGNVREIVGATSDGQGDWQETILDDNGKLIATVHGATEEEAAENAEFIVLAINGRMYDRMYTDK